MYLINPRITSNQLNQEDNTGYNCLITDLDNKILELAIRQYYNEIYGYTASINYDYYDTLCEYREILIDKLLGCNCLEDCSNESFLIYITGNIQKLINSYC